MMEKSNEKKMKELVLTCIFGEALAKMLKSTASGKQKKPENNETEK